MAESKPQHTVAQMLQNLHEYEKARLESQRADLEKSYDRVEAQLEKVSTLTGIPPRRLLRLVNLTAFNFEQVLNWRDVLELLRTFYTYDQNDELMEGYDK